MRRLSCVLFLGCIYLLLGEEKIYSSAVTMQYDQVTLCVGGSFNLSDFLNNQVVVPVDCRLLGWREPVGDVITPSSDTTVHLQYVEKSDATAVREIPFTLRLRDRPVVREDPGSSRVCLYEPFPDVACQVDNADQLYFQQVTTGEKKGRLSDFGPALSEGENRFLVVATNDQCAESVQREISVHVIDPRQYTLSVPLPPVEYSICDDSVLLCDYFELRNLQLLYKKVPLMQLGRNDYSFQMEWLLDDSFTNCDSLVRESYTNTYTVRVYAEEPTCHTTVAFEESNQQKFVCSGLSTKHALSYSCSSEQGILYWGAEWPIESVRFFPLSSDDLPTPMERMDDSYNMDTYPFPNRGSALLCWTNQTKASYRVELTCRNDEGEPVYLSDTIEVESCLKNPPVVRYVCNKGDRRVTVASMEEIVDVQFSSVTGRRMESHGEDVPSFYTHVWSYAVEESTFSSDTIECLVTLKRLNCSFDTLETETRITLYDCGREPRLYYGIYRSPQAILQYKDVCDIHQCVNTYGKEPKMVAYQEVCWGDTLFLKFKAMDLDEKDRYRVSFQTDYTVKVVSPSLYDEEERNEFVFRNVSSANPVVSFVPKQSGVIRGDLGGMAFAFSVQIAERKVENEYRVCSGDTLDLNDWIKGERQGLAWNVQETVVVPTHDEEYYLYGFTKEGCLVDEHVDLKVDYPLWYQVAEKSFCVGNWVDREELLHSNARRSVWYRCDSLLDEYATSVYLSGGDSFRVVLYADCDSAEYRFTVDERDCIEDSEMEDVLVPFFFSPDGDGRNDLWQVSLPLDEATWRCTLYDRFGKVLAEYENQEVSWNGYYRGSRMPATDYWYVILRNDELFKMGHFTLK